MLHKGDFQYKTADVNSDTTNTEIVGNFFALKTKEMTVGKMLNRNKGDGGGINKVTGKKKLKL